MTLAELVKNKERLKAEKLASVVTGKTCSLALRGSVIAKSDGDTSQDENKFTAVINTTNWFDSHRDVHAKGIWGEDPIEGISYVLDHDFSISGLIAQPDDVEVEVSRMRWKQLGLDINGTTDALLFHVELKDYASPAFLRAKNGGVVMQNSVRMRYDEIVLCINNKDSGAEFEAWNKYIKEVANREEAEEVGYFWYVKRARVWLEGSAVLRGSNSVTPMLKAAPEQENETKATEEVKQEENKIESTYSYYKTIH